MLSFLDVKRADRNYEFFFGDLYGLMFNAGKRTSEKVMDEFGSGNRILIVCGTGNNAGDGMVAARLLSENNEVSVFPVKGKDSLRTPESRKAAGKYVIEIIDLEQFHHKLGECDIVVDALFGSGSTGAPKKPYDEIILAINHSGRKIVSIDVPSGMGSDIAVRPYMTVTFTDSKEGMNSENSGKIFITDIGIPQKVFDHCGPGDFVYYKQAMTDSHKGMNGTVAIVGGWTFHGSAIFSAMGALRSGADLVKVFCTSRNYNIIASYNPSIIVRNIDEPEVVREVGNNNVIVLGPGLGKNQNPDALLGSLRDYHGIIILDAEGLEKFDEARELCKDSRFILTPHKAEFVKLTSEEPNVENASKFSRRKNCTMILKGVEDIITDGNRVMYSAGGNPRMTMGGTGDLLTGILASVSSRCEDPFRAACLASFINKKTGDLAYRQRALWYDLDDMINLIPEVMKMSLE
ncbi:MAG: NAD(P)H-hydrate dehydratase [Candidatus Thermoplasmatota archaeon]|nr:NAD(P)H-hydrate dehydratase [Candidatus Thermoplasmatota archaeon]